jgi:hypothetical protein
MHFETTCIARQLAQPCEFLLYLSFGLGLSASKRRGTKIYNRDIIPKVLLREFFIPRFEARVPRVPNSTHLQPRLSSSNISVEKSFLPTWRTSFLLFESHQMHVASRVGPTLFSPLPTMPCSPSALLPQKTRQQQALF